MKRFSIILLMLLAQSLSVLGQSAGGRIVGARPWRAGSSLPATCIVGDGFFLTSGTIGLYECTVLNTWTAGGPIVLADTPLTTRGDLLTVNSTPALSRLAAGASTTVLHGGTDLSFGAVNLAADVSGQLPIAAVGSAGLSATAPATISAAGVIANGLGSVTNDAQTKASIVPNTAPSAGQILVGNAGNTAYAPVSVSGSGVTATLSAAGLLTLSAIPNATLSNSSITVNTTAPITGAATPALGGSVTIACATCSTLTNAAGNNVIPKSNGTNLVASAATDNGTTFALGELGTMTGLGLNGAGASANTINATAGACFQISGGCKFTFNSGSVQANTTLDANGNPFQGYTTISSSTNCAATGTAANPSVASCTAASSGAFSCATNASGGTCTVNTTAVTTNSEIFVQQTEADGGRIGVTCNTSVLSVGPVVTAKSNGVSFTITLGTFITNPTCFNYFIVN